MASTEKDIANFLIAQNFSLLNHPLTALGTDIFVGYTPNSPDALTILRAYPGPGGERAQDAPGFAYEYVYIQVMVRGVPATAGSYDDAYKAVYTLYLTLGTIQNTVLDGVWYRKVMPVQVPFFLGRDENQRERFTFNCRVEKRPSVA